MMLVNVAIRGEPDTKPYTATFHYSESDEIIFSESVKMVKDRLGKGLKININETIALFVGYVVTELRNGRTPNDIKNDIPNLLSNDSVLIGVPESLREIMFTVILENSINAKISITSPIPVSNYILGA